MTQERIQEIIQESLRDWFKKEDWVRIDTQGNITGPCGSMKKGKATTRCSARKKKREGAKGKQFVKNPKGSSYKKGTYQKKSK